MGVSTQLAFLIDICSMYGMNIAQVKVSLTSVAYQVVLNAAKRHEKCEHKWLIEKYMIIPYNSRIIWKKKAKF